MKKAFLVLSLSLSTVASASLLPFRIVKSVFKSHEVSAMATQYAEEGFDLYEGYQTLATYRCRDCYKLELTFINSNDTSLKRTLTVNTFYAGEEPSVTIATP